MKTTNIIHQIIGGFLDLKSLGMMYSTVEIKLLFLIYDNQSVTTFSFYF